MVARSSAGTTLAVTASAPATFNAAGYDALSPTVIGEITDLGEFGREYALVTHNPLASRGTVKLKGSFNEGQLTLQLALDTDDAGQVLLKTASNSDANYYFKLTVQGGDIYYFAAQVMSFKPSIGGVDNVQSASVTLEITTNSAGVGIVEKLAP